MSILKMIAKAIWNLLRAFFGSLGALFGNLIQTPWNAFRAVFKFRSDEVKRPLIALVATLIIVVSAVSIYLSQRPNVPKINLAPFQGLGEVAAEETVKLLNDRGTVVVLALENKEGQFSAFDAPVKAFHNALKAHPNVRAQTTELVQTKLQAMIGPAMLISPDQFFSYLDKHSHADAIVSFVGLPTLQDPDWDRVKERRPKVLMAGAFSPQLKQFMERDVVQVAVTPRFRPAVETKEPETTREWFNRYYTVITLDTMSELPNYGAPATAAPPR